MKIVDIRTYATMPRQARPWLFVLVETDEGIRGIGECSLYNGTRIVSETVETIKPLVIGLDPFNIEEIWQSVFRRYLRIGARGFISAALSGIDIALWDIKGKALGVPVYQLLGGPVRDRVPLYTHVPDALNEQMTARDAVEGALRARDAGFEAVKTDPFRWSRQRSGPFQGASFLERPSQKTIGEGVAWVSSLRDALGPGYEILVDVHARFDPASAVRAANALEPLGLTWFEEPVPPESLDALRQVREQTRVPICVGESLLTRYDFMPILEGRLADYLMPDIAWTGGISELRRIAALAESYYVRLSPHFALGPVSLAASFQVCMTTPNLYRQECFHTWFDDFDKVVATGLDCRDGALIPTDAPGLGVELNMEGVARHAIDPKDPKANMFFI